MRLTREDLLQAARAFLSQPGENQVGPAEAISPALAGLPLFAPPLLGISGAEDPLYDELTAPEAVGPWLLTPVQWLPGACSVLSFFFPFSPQVARSNRQDGQLPSSAWLHGRVEGQALLFRLARRLMDLLARSGWRAVCPCLDPRFASMEHPGTDRRFPPQAAYTSRWSERHAAYISGLGTFGLSAGLITEKGTCGRFLSLITDLPLPPAPRPYSGLYDYCTRCGACARRCPVGAISLEGGKDHIACAYYVDLTMTLCAPRYGCGKCQTGVPCQSRIPAQKPAGTQGG